MSTAVHDHPEPEQELEGPCPCCPWTIRRIFSCFCEQSRNPEKEGLLENGESSTYQTAKPANNPSGSGTNRDEHDAERNPMMNERQSPSTDTEAEKKPVMIEMKLLGLAKVDEIFKQFQDTFNAFYNCECDMRSAVKRFKTAVKTSGEFRECLIEFKRQLNGARVEIKKLALKFPKAVVKGGGSVGDAATALVSVLKAYNDLEKLPVKVTKKSIDCLIAAMKLDLSEIAGEEFEGHVLDLGKVPKQIKSLRENVKEIRKAPKIVKSFFEYATSIVMDVIAVFGDGKSKEELTQRSEKVEVAWGNLKGDLRKAESPEPPKEVKFTSVGIPTIDKIFTDIAKLVNPVIVLSKDLFDARKRLEQAVKDISEFRKDPSKVFDDYLEELKKRLKKGDIHIVISVHGNRIEIEKVEGLEPKETQNMESGFKGVIKSGDELMDLAPDSIKKIINLIQDSSNISKTDFKNHVKSIQEIPSKISAFSENCKKAKVIPGDLNFFLCFVRNLIMDILEVLHTTKTTEEDEALDPEDGDDDDGVNK